MIHDHLWLWRSDKHEAIIYWSIDNTGESVTNKEFPIITIRTRTEGVFRKDAYCVGFLPAGHGCSKDFPDHSVQRIINEEFKFYPESRFDTNKIKSH